VNSGRRVSDSRRDPRKNTFPSTPHRSSRQGCAKTPWSFQNRHFHPAEPVQFAHTLERFHHKGESVGIGAENVLGAADGLRRFDLGLAHVWPPIHWRGQVKPFLSKARRNRAENADADKGVNIVFTPLAGGRSSRHEVYP
jgi:hypothetical protein